MSAGAPTLLFTDDERDAARVRRISLTTVIALYCATRLVVWIAAYTGSIMEFRINLGLERPFSKHEARLRTAFADPTSADGREAVRLLADFAPLCRFDGDHYRSIIEGGYQYKPVTKDAPQSEKEQNIAFFPLYPLLCSPLTAVMSTHTAMILISHGCSLAAMLVLFEWIRKRIDDAVALFTVAIVCCLPQACYFSFGYAESCTLLLVALTFLAIDRRQWLLAAIACGLCTATRPTAASLIPVLLLAYWMFATSSGHGRILRLLLIAVVAGAGIGLYASYLTYRFESPFVYFTNFRMGWVTDERRSSWFEYLTLARVWDQFKYFGRALKFPPVSLVQLINPFAWNMTTNLLIIFISLAGWRRVPRSFRPLLLLGPIVFAQSYLASGGATFGVEPISRYMSVALGAFVVLAAWAMREWKVGYRYALLTVLLLLQGAWAFRFGLGEWSS